MHEGDIYHWRWKDEDRRSMPYCCYAQIAVVWKGKLHDTYCGVLDAKSPLELDEIDIELRGNPDDMIKIMDGFEKYYRPEDIVDTRHSNNPRAPIYLKRGAERDADIMRAWFETKIQENENAILASKRRIEALQKAILQIEAGDVDGVYV